MLGWEVTVRICALPTTTLTVSPTVCVWAVAAWKLWTFKTPRLSQDLHWTRNHLKALFSKMGAFASSWGSSCRLWRVKRDVACAALSLASLHNFADSPVIYAVLAGASPRLSKCSPSDLQYQLLPEGLFHLPLCLLLPNNIIPKLSTVTIIYNFLWLCGSN